MPAHALVDDDFARAVAGLHDNGAAGHQAGGGASADLAEIMAIEVGRDESEDNDQPDGDIAEELADIAAPTGENAYRQKACDRQQIDHLAETLICTAEGLDAAMVEDEQPEAEAEK